MKTINWKGNLIALGVVGTVIGGSFYVNYIKDNSYDTSNITASAASTIDNSQDITVAPYDGTDNITVVDKSTDDNNGIIDTSYLKTPVEQTDTVTEQTKSDPKIGMYWQDAIKTSWGSPEDKTTTKTQYGTTELWIYSGGRSLFFEDGILESITE